MKIETTGRWCELNGEKEVTDLKYGMDFREPRYRREVFLRFYKFHLENCSHPGGVYFAMPWLAHAHEMDVEQRLWFAFINGCSQNVVTTWKIFELFPDVKNLDINKMNDWWNIEFIKFKVGSGWDSDRKYHKIGKTGLISAAVSYKKQVDKFGSQQAMFESLYDRDNPYLTFDNVWNFVRSNFVSFGRLSTFSYLEYLRIMGVPLECGNLFLRDIGGSKSHRNGLCKVLGRDDLDWWDHKDTHNPNFEGYSEPILSWLEEEADQLIRDARILIDHKDVNFFTLESAFCTFKSWFRPNRRYPNVYMDMMHDRIVYAESQWGREFDQFWEMRAECLPPYLLLEANKSDPGLCKEKQNHFRLTGQPIMMDKDWDCFKNYFNDNINKRLIDAYTE